MNIPPPEEPETSPESLPPGRKRLFAACLAFSLLLHLAAALLVLVSGSGSPRGSAAHYVELTAAPAPPPVPEIHAPAPVAPQAQPQVETEPPPEEPPSREVTEPTPAPPGAHADVLATPLGLGMTYGFFKSLGEGRTLREDVREYYFQILERINGVWWQKAAGTAEEIRQDGIVDISIAPDGTLVEARMTVTTGSATIDRVVIESVRESSPFAPPPGGHGQFLFRAPLRIAAPSNLFRLGSGR